MGYGNISNAFMQADIDAVKAAIATINSKMPFLITLATEEKRSLIKLGAKSLDFVTDCSLAVNSYPNILPASFDKTEYGKDVSLFKALTEIKMLIDTLSEKVNDTYVACGNESMVSSLEVYSYVLTAKNKTPGLKSVADKLQERFKKKKKASPDDGTPQQ